MGQVFGAIVWLFRTLPRPVSVLLVLGLLATAGLIMTKVEASREIANAGITSEDYARLKEELGIGADDLAAMTKAAELGKATFTDALKIWKKFEMRGEDMDGFSKASLASGKGLIDFAASFKNRHQYDLFARSGRGFNEFIACRTLFSDCQNDGDILDTYLASQEIEPQILCQEARDGSSFFLPIPESATSKDWLKSGRIEIVGSVPLGYEFVGREVKYTGSFPAICTFDLRTNKASIREE